MAFLQLVEPKKSPAEQCHRKLAVGIDLGTTNSLIATVDSASLEPRVLADKNRELLLPSAVQYGESGMIAIGKAAKAVAIEDSHNVLLSTKRLMGRSYDDIVEKEPELAFLLSASETASTDMVRLQTAAGSLSPVQVAAEILKALVERAHSLGNLEGAVITVPAYFDDAQRQATKEAAKLAGIRVLRLLNEPTAAAIAYGLGNQEAQDTYTLVYDLGGGTFDVSVLHLDKGVFQVLATAGDSALGGDDFDLVIAKWLADSMQLNWSDLSPKQYRQLVTFACRAKEQLAHKERVDISLEGQSHSMDRHLMQSLLSELIGRTIAICALALDEAEISIEDVDAVLMVGGSTRLVSVRQAITDFFGRPAQTSIDPDKVVALGAALQADILVGNKSAEDMLLLDVIPLSLGIEVMGGLVTNIIPRNSTIPVIENKEFTTYKDGQTAMSIHVVQGERELVQDCRTLARFELRDIPPQAAGLVHVDVRFQIDADGLLSVSAIEKASGISTWVEVKPAYGLDEQAIATMLQDSVDNAEVDITERLRREQQVEAERLIHYLSSALDEVGSKLLSESDIQILRQEIDRLKTLLATNTSTYDMINQAVKQLSQLSEPFATRRMDHSIKTALRGRHIEDVPETL